MFFFLFQQLYNLYLIKILLNKSHLDLLHLLKYLASSIDVLIFLFKHKPVQDLIQGNGNEDRHLPFLSVVPLQEAQLA